MNLTGTDVIVMSPALPDGLASLSIDFVSGFVSHSTPDFHLEHSPTHVP